MSSIAIDARIINSTTGRYIERLLYYLQQIDRTNSYTVLVRKKDKNYWQPTASNFTIKVADFDNYSFNEQIGFYKFLKKLKPDLVHFCMPQQPILYHGRKVTTFHDLTLLKVYSTDKNWLIYHLKQTVGRFVFHRVIHTSDAIITDSVYSKKELSEFDGKGLNKTTTIYLAADVTPASPKAYKLPYKKYLLYVGQQSDYKNIKRLGDAHQKLLTKYPDLGLVLVGNKNASAKLNERYFKEKKYKNITYTGFADDTELSWLYSHAAAYVFPSLMEGFGLPGLEAMNYGAPVISSSATCLPEVYGDAAIYFNPNDTNNIASTIDQLLSDDKLRADLIKKGYQQVKKYSWHRMAEQTLAIYEHVLRK